MKNPLVALLLAITLLLTACTYPQTPDNKNGNENGMNIDAITDTVTVTDAVGREVSFSTENLRVAALLGSIADVWCLSGGTLVAAPTDAWEDFSLPLDGAVNIGGAHSPSLEKVLSAAPTLVLASASTASHVALEESLTAAGIAVLYFDLNSFDEYLFMLRACTEALEREDLYKTYGLAQKERIDALVADFRAMSYTEEERKVLFLRASSGFVKAKESEGTVLGSMLLDFGCVNIADGGALTDLSVEAVIREEPYRIFTVTMGSDEAAAEASLARMMAENPAWGTLSAVKEERLHMMDKTLFHLKPNARWGDAYEALFELLTTK